MAHIILQDFPFNCQSVTNRFWKVSSRKVLFEISVLCQSVVIWRCNAHHYCLREARWLMNHVFDMQWSLRFFTSWWHILGASVYDFDFHNTATMTFSNDFFSSLSISRQSAVLFHWSDSNNFLPCQQLSTLSCASSLKGEVSVWTEINLLTGLDDATWSVFEFRAKYYPSSFELTAGGLFDFVLVHQTQRHHHHPLHSWFHWLPPPQHRPQDAFPP